MKINIFLALGLLLLPLATPNNAAEEARARLGYGFASNLIPGRHFVERQLIVGLKAGMRPERTSQLAAAHGGRLVKAIEGALLIEFPSETAVHGALSAFINHADVAFVERNGLVDLHPITSGTDALQSRVKDGADAVNPDAISTDVSSGTQWHLPVIRKTAALPALSATPPTVAVVDTGVDYTHPDLAGKVILGRNCLDGTLDPYDDRGHGTHVAGIIAAKAGNGLYGEGVCPNCKILAVKVFPADGPATSFDLACGLQFARTKATTPPTKIINASWGGGDSTLVATEVLAIKTAGKLLVASAGNDNTTSTYSAFPGADPNTGFRVMATEQTDCRTYFSNFSPAANPALYNIAAPGFLIPSTLPGSGFAPLSGTSMAAPVVAGAAAVVWGQMPLLTRDQLVTRLLTNGKATACGFAAQTRRVDVRKALLGTTENAIIGRIIDPFTGRPPLTTAPTNVSLLLGTSKLAEDVTDSAGIYELTGLAVGTGRTLRGARTGYLNAQLRTNVNVTSVPAAFTDALAKARSVGNATITLDWRRTQPFDEVSGCYDECNGWDLDLWVDPPSGSDIGWSYHGAFLTAPFVFYPRDSSGTSKYDPNGSLEPVETIVIGSPAADGRYRVIVSSNYSANPSWTGSQASVSLFNGATPIGKFYPGPPAACGTNNYWHVGNLTKSGTSYTWQSVNTCSYYWPY